jgi:hypothetical protein
MRFLRTAGYAIWDHKRNENILTELQISQITEFICQYRKNWKEHVDRMSSNRIPKIILKYQPKWKKKFRQTFEKIEGFSFVTPVTGLKRPNTEKDDDDDERKHAYKGIILFFGNYQIIYQYIQQTDEGF